MQKHDGKKYLSDGKRHNNEDGKIIVPTFKVVQKDTSSQNQLQNC